MDDSLKFKGLAHENKFLVFEFVGEKFRNLVHSILNRTPSVQKKLDLGLHILFFFGGEGGGEGRMAITEMREYALDIMAITEM